ncbi:MAG: LPXTG cell wall anchor domain-containing protein [Gemmiger sp.]
MKFVKRLSTLLLALSLGAAVALPAYAHEVPDPSRTGSIRFSMLYDGSAVGGGSLTLHRVGDVAEEDGNYTFTLTEAYAASGADLTDLTDTALAAGLADYTTANGIAGEEVTIGSDGTAAADGLALGLYLVMQDQPAEGYEPIAPFLVSVPMWDETAGAYLYTVDAAPKLGGLTKTPPAATAAPAKPDAGDPDTVTAAATLPQTGQLNWPVPVLTLAGLLLMLAGWYLRARAKETAAR